MNEYDTELVRAILLKAGYAFVTDEREADVVMLNTCAVRENAHRRVYGRIHEIRHKRREAAAAAGAENARYRAISSKIGILGCMATSLRTGLLEDRGLDIDFIAGPDSYKRLPDLIEESFREGRDSRPFDLTLSEFETYGDVYPRREGGVNAWIAVMRGCNNFCTFCVVPYTRGRERSRGVDNVVEEARRLAGEGFQQITLLGQNVNSYHHEGRDFADLMAAVCRVEGIRRVRFTSPHPKDFPDKLLGLMADEPKVCRQIHLPLQAGSDRVLGRMNRAYTREEFLRVAAALRAALPEAALSTDVIAGFPGETDADFEDTLEVMRAVEFDSAFTFKYSERKNTIASRQHPDNVPEAVKTGRVVRLVELQREISLRKNQAHVGQTLTALVEKDRAEKSAGHALGRLDNNKLVTFENSGGFRVGDWVDVKINRATPHGLKGAAVFV
jgi:tRNA-2-methylthio-N6-dimethylallyladenosine synthase